MTPVRCRYCPQALTTPESRARGYGPVCGQRRGLLPPTPHQRRPAASVTAVTKPDVHPDQTTIPIQPELPEEST
ncbi:DUF6011 domain-containing protein [Streptomyces sp. NPDC059477]|uniref:DUF6011 domain-containing protein n=1 Tax=Streptomyces sp. NPDC059477 TaxID=3346847 RepID=UPI0036BF84DF